MNTPSLRGQQIAEQNRELAWRRDAGYSQVFRMRGLKPFIYAQLPFWQVTADEVRIMEDLTPYATLEARINTVLDGRAEVPINVWELIGQDINHDLYEHPLAGGISETELAKLRKAVDQNRRGETVSVFPNDSNALTMYGLLSKGTDSFVRCQYVLRKSQTVTSNFTLAVSTYGVDAIWSLNQIYAIEPIYNRIYDTIVTIAEPTAKPGFVFGWLKKSPQITAEANNKIRITQEWWLEQWSTWIYQSLF